MSRQLANEGDWHFNKRNEDLSTPEDDVNRFLSIPEDDVNRFLSPVPTFLTFSDIDPQDDEADDTNEAEVIQRSKRQAPTAAMDLSLSHNDRNGAPRPVGTVSGVHYTYCRCTKLHTSPWYNAYFTKHIKHENKCKQLPRSCTASVGSRALGTGGTTTTSTPAPAWAASSTGAGTGATQSVSGLRLTNIADGITATGRSNATKC